MALILLVDDAPVCRDAIASSLEKTGFQTVRASNGKEALEIIESAPPDLILLDLAMPTMDGATLLKRIRANPATANIPVIVLTAGDNPAVIGTLGALGPSDFMFKSQFSTAQLIARVQKLLATCAT
jgi:CheY-like chemotaxis protein